MATYHTREVYADNYAKGYVEAIFAKKGISVIVREKLSAVYVNFKTLVLASRLMLPDVPGLRSGLTRTPAYYGRSNTLSIGHERSIDSHGDEADAVVTAVYAASQKIAVASLSPEDLQAARTRAKEMQNYDRLRIGLRSGDRSHFSIRR